MSTVLNRQRVKEHLDNANFQSLFVEDLGWDHGGNNLSIFIDEMEYLLKPIAQKRGMVAYMYLSDSADSWPDGAVRSKISHKVAKTTREHLIVFVDTDKRVQYWQWVKRRRGCPDRVRLHTYYSEKSGESLIQRLEKLIFTLDQEESTTIVDVVRRAEEAFNVDKVTRAFYLRFENEKNKFQEAIRGIEREDQKEWYASLTLYRMMFIYFIQKRGFLDNDVNYLVNKLRNTTTDDGKDISDSFFRKFLMRLFHEGLNQPIELRDEKLMELLGSVPFLNGGLFEIKDIEIQSCDLDIPDSALMNVLEFFDSYQWHLDDRPTGNDNEINPDVLGYIFEKYVNQKEKGAYYTKEDVTNYICRSTIIPWILSQVNMSKDTRMDLCVEAQQQLSDEPTRYIYESIGYGDEEADRLRPQIDNGVVTFKENSDLCSGGMGKVLNSMAPSDVALPSETWRSKLARGHRFRYLRSIIKSGEIKSIDALITNNLNLEQLIQDLIIGSNNEMTVLRYWNALQKVRILDPTCGSGAFLFAALNVLEPIYTACLETMWQLATKPTEEGQGEKGEVQNEIESILNGVERHGNTQYYILKTIMLKNLYGVDIMPEAVEICKLRLFLKLAAQLKNVTEIEPLPDVDFNILEGNALLGFGSLSELQEVLGKNIVRKDVLPSIIDKMKIVSIAYNEFCTLQSMGKIDAVSLYSSKVKLKKQIEELRNILDRHLMDELDQPIRDNVEYNGWRAECKPFHWLAEYFDIMNDGGFDVIIGNPPWVTTKKIDYEIFGPSSKKYRDIYGYVVERSLALASNKNFCGMIVPLSLVFSRDFAQLRKKITENGACWTSTFSIRPSMLFAGVEFRNTIWIGSRAHSGIHSSPIYRWQEDFRRYLFDQISYTRVSSQSTETTGIPKVSSTIQAKFIENNEESVVSTKRSIGEGDTGAWLGFSPTGGNYLSTFVTNPPSIDAKNGTEIESKKFGKANLVNEEQALAALAITSGEYFYWYWLVWGDQFHLTTGLVNGFIEILTQVPDEQYQWLAELGRRLTMESAKYLKFMKYAGIWIGNYDYRKASAITRRADLILFASMGWETDALLDVYNYIQIYLSVADRIMQRAIPKEIAERYMHDQSKDSIEIGGGEELYERIDGYLMESLNISREVLEYLLYYDLEGIEE